MSGFDSALPVAAMDRFMPMETINPPMFDGESEEALALRFSRKSKERQKLVLEFTRDPALLHQYYLIYQAECRMIPEFMAAEEEYNRNSHILIIRAGNLVVGGGRLMVNTPRLQRKLLLELAGFNLHEHFPELEQKQLKYAELSRLVALPDFRSTSLMRDIILTMQRKCVAHDIDLLFACAPLLNVRTYRQISRSIGLKTATVHMNIDIPPDPGFEEVRDYLFSCWTEKQLEKEQQLPMETDLLLYESV